MRAVTACPFRNAQLAARCISFTAAHDIAGFRLLRAAIALSTY